MIPEKIQSRYFYSNFSDKNNSIHFHELKKLYNKTLVIFFHADHADKYFTDMDTYISVTIHIQVGEYSETAYMRSIKW